MVLANNSVVAAGAEQASDLARVVIVIDSQPYLELFGRSLAYGALALLFMQ